MEPNITREVTTPRQYAPNISCAGRPSANTLTLSMCLRLVPLEEHPGAEGISDDGRGAGTARSATETGGEAELTTTEPEDNPGGGPRGSNRSTSARRAGHGGLDWKPSNLQRAHYPVVTLTQIPNE